MYGWTLVRRWKKGLALSSGTPSSSYASTTHLLFFFKVVIGQDPNSLFANTAFLSIGTVVPCSTNRKNTSFQRWRRSLFQFSDSVDSVGSLDPSETDLSSALSSPSRTYWHRTRWFSVRSSPNDCLELQYYDAPFQSSSPIQGPSLTPYSPTESNDKHRWRVAPQFFIMKCFTSAWRRLSKYIRELDIPYKDRVLQFF